MSPDEIGRDGKYVYKTDTVNIKSAYRVPNRHLNIAVYGISVYRCITNSTNDLYMDC
jgi:hypothetical protein